MLHFALSPPRPVRLPPPSDSLLAYACMQRQVSDKSVTVLNIRTSTHHQCCISPCFLPALSGSPLPPAASPLAHACSGKSVTVLDIK
eukprot:365007-Chlamydomonas_euryale.AAC.1